jgi:hypothetical protein
MLKSNCDGTILLLGTSYDFFLIDKDTSGFDKRGNLLGGARLRLRRLQFQIPEGGTRTMVDIQFHPIIPALLAAAFSSGLIEFLTISKDSIDYRSFNTSKPIIHIRFPPAATVACLGPEIAGSIWFLTIDSHILIASESGDLMAEWDHEILTDAVHSFDFLDEFIVVSHDSNHLKYWNLSNLEPIKKSEYGPLQKVRCSPSFPFFIPKNIAETETLRLMRSSDNLYGRMRSHLLKIEKKEEPQKSKTGRTFILKCREVLRSKNIIGFGGRVPRALIAPQYLIKLNDLWLQQTEALFRVDPGLSYHWDPQNVLIVRELNKACDNLDKEKNNCKDLVKRNEGFGGFVEKDEGVKEGNRERFRKMEEEAELLRKRAFGLGDRAKRLRSEWRRRYMDPES